MSNPETTSVLNLQQETEPEIPATSSSSTTNGTSCPTRKEGTLGFKITIKTDENLEGLTGACMHISPGPREPPQAPTDAALITADGKLFLSANKAGPYYIRATKDHATDPQCYYGADDLPDHPGAGVVELAIEAYQICA